MGYEPDRMFKRRAISASFVGVAAASWAFHMYLWQSFLQSNPQTPNPDTGFSYVMNNHGFYYYLTAIQTTQLGLMVYLAGGAFLLATLVNGRTPEKQAWEVYAKPVQAPAAFIVIPCLIWLVILSLCSYAWASRLVQSNLVIAQ